VLGNGKAVRYPVGVGRAGKQWTGTAYINGKQLRPAWSPPAEVKRDKPSLPNVIAGGSPGNPMGAAALTLSGGGEYAIHGTNNPGSIGGFVSYGCIRMYNADVLDLYNRVGWGTTVVVTR
jgi:lipoprotein-anchoring transpeptidase ErfK/SrfK